MTSDKIEYNHPDATGHFGQYGGLYVAETLMPLLIDVAKQYEAVKADPEFQKELDYYLKQYVGRENPLYFAQRLTEHCGGAKIYLKREDLNHTGAHKINNCLGQIILAKRMGKTRIIAETGAGQHGVATATVCALFNIPCVIFMGAKDIERQKPNVFRMKLLGAEVIPVTAGSATLKDAMNEALRDWVTNVHNSYYLIGTAAGPHPYPMMVRDFQAVIGREVKEQIMAAEGRLPDAVVASVGGGSNAIGIFYPFIKDRSVELVAVEAAGKGLNTKEHAASISKGIPGVLHGSKTYLLQDEDGQINDTHSISAGLDYPGIGPELSFLHDAERVKFVATKDDDALRCFTTMCQLEGIIPALECSHATSHVMKMASKMKPEQIIVMNLSGRGDKDIFTVAKALGVEI